MTLTWIPDFADEVPTLALLDPLGALLAGSVDPVPVSYRFADAVRLSGHCCPTVAGAWAMLLHALPRLYPDSPPVRGAIAISAPGRPDAGAIGPFTQVLGLVTGAAADNGFRGLSGHHARNGLLRYRGSGDLADPFVFQRLDTGARLALRYDGSVLPEDPELGGLLGALLNGGASERQRRDFGARWQRRVRALLLDPACRRRAIIEVDCGPIESGAGTYV